MQRRSEGTTWVRSTRGVQRGFRGGPEGVQRGSRGRLEPTCRDGRRTDAGISAPTPVTYHRRVRLPPRQLAGEPIPSEEFDSPPDDLRASRYR
eukprot:959263-Prorocentrum_minimum.AAC.1